MGYLLSRNEGMAEIISQCNGSSVTRTKVIVSTDVKNSWISYLVRLEIFRTLPQVLSCRDALGSRVHLPGQPRYNVRSQIWVLLNSTFRILRSMAEGVRKSLQEGGRDLYGLCAGPGPG